MSMSMGELYYSVMNITFLGGADEVGASSLLIEIGGRRLLVDAGIRPTPKARWGLAGDQLPDLDQIERSGGIDAILVTHAHTDHTGALELVTERYPNVPVYATPVTIELTRVLHQDARRIMQMRLEDEGELPLFDEVATTRLLNAFTPVQLLQPLTLAPGLTATFFLAGHIAGAAMIGLSSSEGRILISGDISISPQRTVDGARPPAFSPDVLILESTYGGRLHANRHAEERRLVETVAEVTAAGGKVLIPAFALGRAQEILLTLGEFQRRGELAGVPVWADGMVRAICQSYSSFPAALPLALQEQGAAFYTDKSSRWPAQPNATRCSGSPAPPSLSPVRACWRAAHRWPMPAAWPASRSTPSCSPATKTRSRPAAGCRRWHSAGAGRCVLARTRSKCKPGWGRTRSPPMPTPGNWSALWRRSIRRRSFWCMATRTHATVSPLRCGHAGATCGCRAPGRPLALTSPQLCVQRLPQGIGRRRPLDLQRLSHALQASVDAAAGAGDMVTLLELAQIWWGERPAPSPAQVAALAAALAADDRYFAPDRQRAAVYRVRARDQVELATRRRRKSRRTAISTDAGCWRATRRGKCASRRWLPLLPTTSRSRRKGRPRRRLKRLPAAHLYGLRSGPRTCCMLVLDEAATARQWRGCAGAHGRYAGRAGQPGANGAEPGAGHGQCPLSARSAPAPRRLSARRTRAGLDL